MSKEIFRRAYVHYPHPGVTDVGELMTKQSFKDECDINTIMKRYERSGILPTPMGGEPRYLDVSSVDYLEAMQSVSQARTMFQDLPAHVRDRFENSPARLLEFLEDGRNVEEGRKLGLLRPAPEVATPVPVSVVGSNLELPGVSGAPVSAPVAPVK